MNRCIDDAVQQLLYLAYKPSLNFPFFFNFPYELLMNFTSIVIIGLPAAMLGRRAMKFSSFGNKIIFLCYVFYCF